MKVIFGKQKKKTLSEIFKDAYIKSKKTNFSSNLENLNLVRKVSSAVSKKIKENRY